MNQQTKIPTLDEIREALAPILKAGGAKKAVVFGSYARGEADQYSDLDLIIVAESERLFIERFKDFPEVFEAWHKGIDLLIYTPHELADMVERENPFIERALQEGVVIYEE
ncbi:MAG: nucleotidyltransferase domain-containing protein [Chloroflexi bacterium]|nr:nucleotidyltransferase domain-containing protein [Chloroflexota bacterium]